MLHLLQRAEGLWLPVGWLMGEGKRTEQDSVRRVDFRKHARDFGLPRQIGRYILTKVRNCLAGHRENVAVAAATKRRGL